MGCNTCGKSPKKFNPVNKRGVSLNKYAFLNPNQLAIKKAQEEKENQDKDK